jgi:hypothetical protein
MRYTVRAECHDDVLFYILSAFPNFRIALRYDCSLVRVSLSLPFDVELKKQMNFNMSDKFFGPSHFLN